MRLRINVFVLLFMFFAVADYSLFGQDWVGVKDGVKEEIYFDRSGACDTALVFTVVEQMPMYSGGHKQLGKDLNGAVTLDKKEKDEFYFRCVVNCKGEVFSFEERKGRKSDTIEKIKIALLELQNWEAGKQRGESVDCFYSFSVKVKKGKIKISR